MLFEQAARELSTLGIAKAERTLQEPVVLAFCSDIVKIQKAFEGRLRFGNGSKAGYKEYVAIMQTIDPARIAKVIFRSILNTLTVAETAAKGGPNDTNFVFQQLIDAQLIQRYIKAAIGNAANEIDIQDQMQFWLNVVLDFAHDPTQSFIETYKETFGGAPKGYLSLRFKEAAKATLDALSEDYSYTLNRPMMYPAQDWSSPECGGYVTREMQRANPLSRRHKELPSKVLEAINRIQKTSFTVSPKGIEVMQRTLKARRNKINELKQQLRQAEANFRIATDNASL